MVLCTRRAASRSGGGGGFWAIKKCRRGEVIRIIACSTNESARSYGGGRITPLNAALTRIYFHCIDLINYVHRPYHISIGVNMDIIYTESNTNPCRRRKNVMSDIIIVTQYLRI